MNFPGYVVLSRHEAANAILGRRGAEFKFLISIGDYTPDKVSKRVSGYYNFPQGRRIRLEFDDVNVDLSVSHGYVRATRKQVEALIKFCERADRKTLIHCEAGISRSAAAAIVFTLVKLGPGSEEEAVRTLKAHGVANGRTFSPNKWVIHLADEILGCGGLLEHYLNEYYPSAQAMALEGMY